MDGSAAEARRRRSAAEVAGAVETLTFGDDSEHKVHGDKKTSARRPLTRTILRPACYVYVPSTECDSWILCNEALRGLFIACYVDFVSNGHIICQLDKKWKGAQPTSCLNVLTSHVPRTLVISKYDVTYM